MSLNIIAAQEYISSIKSIEIPYSTQLTVHTKKFHPNPMESQTTMAGPTSRIGPGVGRSGARADGHVWDAGIYDRCSAVDSCR